MGYALQLWFFPSAYRVALEPYGQSGVVWFLAELIFLGGLALLLDRYLRAGALLLLFIMTAVELVSWPLSEQLDWTYLGWTLIALILLRAGVEREKLGGLGWIVGGATFFLQGVAKLLNTGADWWNGKVIHNVFVFSMPRWEALLTGLGIERECARGAAWLTLIFHLATLPCALYRPARKYILVAAIGFHLAIAFSPLYYVSFGMLPFWLFLAASAGKKTPP